MIRQEAPEDKRSRLVYLTETGEQLAEIVNPLIASIYKELERNINPKQLQSCLEQLNKVNETLNKI